MLDCIISGGTVIDGTGAARQAVDVGIAGGEIVALGAITAPARRVIDARGRIVAPGFIDVHTHYDAQIMWDPALLPSALHGVTTIIGGNCGFTIAPVDASSADYILRMLACVEGMPVASLQQALQFRWGGFGEWLAQLAGNVALNCGFLVGHSTLRRLVMGEDWRRPAQEEQIRAMEAEVDAALEAGALGFSSSWSEAHGDHLGNPVPSRFAQADELIRLAARLRRHAGTVLEFVPSMMPEFPLPAMQVMADMAVAADRKLNWNLISVGTGVSPAEIEQRLSSCDLAARQGARMVGLMLPVPQPVWVTIGMIGFNAFPLWRQILSLPFAERIDALRRPATRAALAAAMAGKTQRHIFQFHKMTIERLADPALRHLQGRRLAEVAAERGLTPLEAFIEISVQDGLQTYFRNAEVGHDDEAWRLRARLWNDPRVILGGSDAGAHIDTIDCFAYCTDLIGPSVRERGLIGLEAAVHKLTGEPAGFLGLRRRGRIAPGFHADITVFDADRVAPEPVRVQNDMPGDELRLFAGAIGIEHVLVNGIEIVTAGRPTGARPGTVLRGGQDTGPA